MISSHVKCFFFQWTEFFGSDSRQNEMEVYRIIFGVDEKRDQQFLFLKGIDKWLLVD